MTDVADTKQLFRIIQSIPSPKSEPFKLWLARVGRERIEETIDPELATTTEISKREQPTSFDENVKIAKRGGVVAGNARKDIEQETSAPVITSKNATELNKVVTALIEGIAEDADDEE